MKPMRLDRYVAHCGAGSRKEVRHIIKKGLVTVNGEIISDPAFSVRPGKVTVAVDGSPLRFQQYHYLMMNKPGGVISATSDNVHTTVIDLLPEHFRTLKLFPVGRLDKDTEGLLILSDDGQLAHRLLSPRKLVAKTYFAIVEGRITPEDIEAFAEGITLSDFKTLPSQLIILDSALKSEVQVTVYEGKFHQIKRMFEAVGKKVLYLKRIQMGNLKLDQHLKPGETRELSPDEIECLKNSVK